MELIGKKILKDLVDRKIGYGIVQPGQNVDNGIPVIKVNNIISGLSDVNLLDKTTVENSNKYKRTLLQGGELLISLVGSVGKTAIVPKSFSGCNLVRATGLIDIKNPLICKWTKYFIDSKYGQTYINNNLNTTVQPTLNIDSLEKMEIPFFQKEYMEKAVNILHSLDDKIELNNKINENLEQQAQALFKNWFVDFEPFGGKMLEGWKEKTLDTFCNIFTGRKNANASVTDGKYKFFTCSPKVLPIDSFIFDGDAIIISGNGAYTGRTRFYSGKFDLYQRTYACTIKEDQNPDYIFVLYWIIRFVLSKKIMGGTHGSAIPYIVMDDIAKFIINYDKKVFDDLSKIMKSYVLQIQDNENQNEKLAELRDSLLPKLMNGEIAI